MILTITQHSKLSCLKTNLEDPHVLSIYTYAGTQFPQKLIIVSPLNIYSNRLSYISHEYVGRITSKTPQILKLFHEPTSE